MTQGAPGGEPTLPHPGGVTGAAAERYRLLLEVNNALVSNLTRDALFHAIAQALERVLPFERTAIFLHDPARDALCLFLLESKLPSNYFTVGLELRADESHVGWVFQHRRPRLRRDLEREREFEADELAYRDGIRAYVIVPLLARGRPIGTLAVASVTPGCYGDADVALLQEVANQVALAIENMKAYEEIAALKQRLERENVYLREEIKTQHDFEEIVGTSAGLRKVLELVETVAGTDSTVLVSGETGTGKELVARAIHARSRRRDRLLVKVNCSALSAGLVESELFGHVKGAFTGAIQRRTGRFELADGGTLFLDEVGDLPPDTQVKLLRVLQEGEFEPVGSSRTARVDVRVIAATNRDLAAEVAGGRFRADLFYRLNVFPLRLPALRDRPEDIPQLVTFYLERFARRFDRRVEAVAAETMARLVAYRWPGNVRELQNVIERGVVLARDRVLVLDPDSLSAVPPEAAPGPRADPRPPPAQAAGLARPGPGPVPLAPAAGGRPGPEAGAAATTAPAPAAGEARGATPRSADGPEAPPASLEEVERRHILGVLARTGGLIEGPRGAAAILGLHPNTLRSRMKKLAIRRTGHEMS